MKIFILLLTGLVIGIYTYKFSPPIFKTYSVKVEAIEEVITPTPTPTDAEVVGQIVVEFAEHDRHVIKQAIDIFYCESGLRWNAENYKNSNGSNDGGVAQINSVHGFTMDERLDYIKNLQIAHKMYDRQGWNPWTCAEKLGY